MNNVLKFPDRFYRGKRAYRIPLYTDHDIDLVLFCVNAYGETENRVIIDDLIKMDPVDVMKSIDFALQSEYISNVTKEHLECIRKSVEELPIRN